MNCHSKHFKDVAKLYDCNLNKGLNDGQVIKRQSQYGENKLKEKKRTNIFIRYLMQLNDFMILVLIGAAAISFFVSLAGNEPDYLDAIIILVIVMLNALLGLIQESKAEKSIEALKKMSAPTSKVLRNGFITHVSTEQLVPGDLLVLETGDFVSADARLISSINMKAEESALTGESVPVDKEATFIAPEGSPIGDRRNMVFSGSSISYGRGMAIVTAIGMDTEVGKIAHMLMLDDAPETPLQKKLGQTGKMLGIGALAICFGIFLLGIIRQLGVFEMFMTSVSLAVAAIPEGLPAIVTIMLAIGVQQMAKRNAIIRKLPAVETLGSATVICSDKTGTLTQNKMTVVDIYSAAGSCGCKSLAGAAVLQYAAMCNDTVLNGTGGNVLLTGEPTEKALALAAYNINLDKNNLERQMPRIDEIPFESSRKLMSTIHKRDTGGYLAITKGAPDILINKCTFYYENEKKITLSKEKLEELLRYNDEMAGKALRVLGVAYKEMDNLPLKINKDTIECGLVFAGLVGMMDPPREEVKEAVETCIGAGITPVMITGDHSATAIAIAKKLGIIKGGEMVMSGHELDAVAQDELEKNIYKYRVFARVSPEHKVRIVKAFQKRGEVVAMTGDGVNDAPALKAADIGCAMGISGTDVAKGAADIILTDDNFATIVEAVKEGRGIYSNIRKAVHFLLSSNIGEILVMLVALLMNWVTPLLAIHLLWTNLVTDSLPAIALGLDPADKNIMQRKPYSSTKSLFDGGLWQRIVIEGAMIGMLSLVAFGIGSVFYDGGLSHSVGRTMAFATLSISQLVHSFNMRSDKSIFNLSLTSNIYLVYAFIAGLALQCSVIMVPFLANTFKVVPLTAAQWLAVAGLSLMPIAIVELEKGLSGDLEAKGDYNSKPTAAITKLQKNGINIKM